jgi:GNAT superfamily N-acetyltransferase
MRVLQKIKNRGVLHTIEAFFNRLVPSWVFRFSVGDVLELNLDQLCDVYQQTKCGELQTQCVTDSAGRALLRKITWNSVPLSSSSNDYGYAVLRTGRDEKILGGVWGGIDSFLEADLGFQIRLTDDQAWIYCAYVEKEARGSGAYRRVLSFAAHDLRERGYQRLLVVIQPWNKASMYIHKKFAKQTVGRIIAVRLLFLASVFRTGSLAKSKTFTTKLESDPVKISIPPALL